MAENISYTHWATSASYQKAVAWMMNQKDDIVIPHYQDNVASACLPDYSGITAVDSLAGSTFDDASDLLLPTREVFRPSPLLFHDSDSMETEESVFSYEGGSTPLPEAAGVHMSAIMSQEVTTSPVTILAGNTHPGSFVDLDTPTTSQDDCMRVTMSTEEVLASSEDTQEYAQPDSTPTAGADKHSDSDTAASQFQKCQDLLTHHGFQAVTPYMLKSNPQDMVYGICLYLDWKMTKGSLARGLIACNLNPLKAKPATRIALELFFELDSENEKDLKKFENMRNRLFQRKTEERIENEIAAMLAKYKSVSMDPRAWYSISCKVAETIIAGSVVSRGACSLWFVTPIMILQRLLQSEYGTLQVAHLESEMNKYALLRSELVPVLRFERSPRRFPQAKKSGFTPYHLIKGPSVGRSLATATFEEDQRVLAAWCDLFGSNDF